MDLIDFHAHILPGVDDGAKDLEETRKLLVSQKMQGVSRVVATPHYLKHTSISEFVKQRDAALELVKNEIHDDVPQIIPGAEVELYYGFTRKRHLERLCIQNTNYILIELPFEFWNEWIYEELYQLSVKHKLRPIIAHLDRYITTVRNLKFVNKLLEKDVLIQVNAGALLRFTSRSIVKEFWKRDALTILGSDCHDSIGRKCELLKAYTVLKKKFGEDVLQKILENGEKILKNQDIFRY
ncbi:MAG: hypothetical protein IJF61_00705 [Clostridia bacterium]|nr:hypothetical protein [Clostridia bacterium]